MSGRYVVIGAGAVGATVAAQLDGAGIAVVAVARGANLEVLRSQGLRYIRPDGDRRVALEVAGGPDEVDLRADDVLVLASKSQDSEALLQQWAWRPVDVHGSVRTAAEVLPVLLLQNGLDNARTALRRFATVIDAVVIIPSSHLRPAEVISPGAPIAGAFYLGRAGRVPRGSDPVEPGPTVTNPVVDPAVERVAAELRRASFAVQVVADIARWKAGKLLGNLAYNLDALYAPSELRDTASAALVDEARAVFAAAGIEAADVQTDGGLDLSQLVVHDIPGHQRQGSSTWQSLARGGSVESDFLNGEIVLLARLHGLDAPVNAGVQQRIATASLTGTPPGGLGQADLAALLASAGHAPASAGEAAGATDKPSVAFSEQSIAEGEDIVTVGESTVTAGEHTGTIGETGGTVGEPADQSGSRHGDSDRSNQSGRSGRPVVLVDAKQLHDELSSAAPPLLLDVRWALGDPHGREHHRDGHLPGAVYVDLDTELAATPGGTAGRHPLPDIAALQRSARAWGLTAGRPVVVYDDNGGQSAARAWWLLRWAGVTDVRILDGALTAWREAGFPLETGETVPAPGDVELTAGHLPVLDADAAAHLAGTGVLLDARAPERYRGEVEPVDPRAGHIPGAVSAPTGENLDGGGRFLSEDLLRARFTALGAGASAGDARPVGVYCGSGVTAAHQIAALAVAGIDAALFPGSWSAWSSDPTRPVATGERSPVRAEQPDDHRATGSEGPPVDSQP
ncbi:MULTISPECIES: rhodanese-like domain-containing protein [unclassified Frankia]|uniref:rhodanese-like domain-containing protein n=1 Tax=unclassified Frankia TaxID=2632575 RepID=UPI002023FDD6